MRIAGIYSFKEGKQVVEANIAAELQEIEQAIAAVDGTKHKTKVRGCFKTASPYCMRSVKKKQGWSTLRRY